MSLRSREITSTRVRYPENKIYREGARGRETESREREREVQTTRQGG